MILSCRFEATKEIYKGDRTADLPADIQRVALRKLQQLDIAQKLDDLWIPPGNRLEPLKGDRKGQHSIRINNKYRIGFIWTDRGIEDVEIVDYH
jgi:proteic killer suppression protein